MRLLRMWKRRRIRGDRNCLRWKGRAVVFPTRARFTVHAAWRVIRIRRFDLAIGTRASSGFADCGADRRPDAGRLGIRLFGRSGSAIRMLEDRFHRDIAGFERGGFGKFEEGPDQCRL
jgi:hypothetical protein